MSYRVLPWSALLALLLVPLWTTPAAADANPTLLAGMKWRQIGPFRGGRVLAVTGVSGEPNTWYFGGVAGGVWKSADVGASWKPMFDQQPIASIGALAVAERQSLTAKSGRRQPVKSGFRETASAEPPRKPRTCKRRMKYKARARQSYCVAVCLRIFAEMEQA